MIGTRTIERRFNIVKDRISNGRLGWNVLRRNGVKVGGKGFRVFLELDGSEQNIFEGQSLKLFRRISSFRLDAVVAAAAAAPAPIAVIHAALPRKQLILINLCFFWLKLPLQVNKYNVFEIVMIKDNYFHDVPSNTLVTQTSFKWS
jgi:hypothetical protein